MDTFQDARLVWMALTAMFRPSACHFQISTYGNCPQCTHLVIGPHSDHYTVLVHVANKDTLSDAVKSLQDEFTAEYIECPKCAPARPGPATRVNNHIAKNANLVLALNTHQMGDKPIRVDDFVLNTKPYFVLAAVEFAKEPVGHWTAYLKNSSGWWVCKDNGTEHIKELPAGFFALVFAAPK